MSISRLLWLLALSPLFAACSAAAPGQDSLFAGRPEQGNVRFVLVAGDGSLPVFDDAVVSVGRRMLDRSNSTDTDYLRLSASQDAIAHGIPAATLDNVVEAIGRLHPMRGHSCFVFATSHGTKDTGLVLAGNDYLTPKALDEALTHGCGNAPTAVVISGCYSGAFAKPPMTRANRVILTAASADRTSFGCQAGRSYTVYDKCLLDAFDAGGTWMTAFGSIRSCVRAEEEVENAYPLAAASFLWAGRCFVGSAHEP